MDYKAQFDNIKSLNKQLEEITMAQNQAYDNLPPEIYEKVKEQHLDMNRLMREFKGGNTNALNELVNKYINKK